MAKTKTNQLNSFKRFFLLLFIVVVTISIVFGSKIINNPINVYTVEKGSISYEEMTEGFVIRDETVLEGENQNNGLVQIISENQRVAKDENVFRYYSSGEEELLQQISDLDTQINEEIENSGMNLLSSDISGLKSQIETNIMKMYNVNEMQKMQEYKKKIEEVVTQKAKISAENSPEGSEVRNLINKRQELEETLNSSSELVKAPIAGLVSYRVDGLEEELKTDDFSYLNKELLDSFELKVGSVIPQSNQKGKIINNYDCYIAVYMNSERAATCKVGDNVKIRLSNSGKVIGAKIVYVADDVNNGKIIVLYIKNDVESLAQYRKISIELIWWSYSGFKVPNNSITVENDISYINKSDAGFSTKIPIKIERQNETYSIIDNYTKEELQNIGFTKEEADSFTQIKLYDQIIID